MGLVASGMGRPGARSKGRGPDVPFLKVAQPLSPAGSWSCGNGSWLAYIVESLDSSDSHPWATCHADGANFMEEAANPRVSWNGYPGGL